MFDDIRRSVLRAIGRCLPSRGRHRRSTTAIRRDTHVAVGRLPAPLGQVPLRAYPRAEEDRWLVRGEETALVRPYVRLLPAYASTEAAP